MIKGQNETEATYRAIQTDSSSSLKDFSMDRKKYYRKYVLRESIEDKDNQAITMGKLVETLLMEPEEFDKRFYMSLVNNIPTGLMLEFVEGLYKATKEATDDFGIVTKSFEELSKEAYILSGFKIKHDQVLNKFIGSDAQFYYEEIRKVRSQNLIVVNSQDVNNSEKIVDELRTNKFTKDLVNIVTDFRYTVINQMQIHDYVIDGHHFKSMLDKVIVDHHKKEIQIIDLKCTWTVENFYSEYYLYRRAYIQAYLYRNAVKSLTEKVEDEWYGYQVLNPMFLVCDSTNYYSPLIYQVSDKDMQDSYLGFEYRNKEYPGVKEIIENLKWALDENIWNISRKNFESNGVVKITN
jgi:hypothetical protein